MNTNSHTQPIALCSDHAGFELKEYIKSVLTARSIEFRDFGAHSQQSVDYADYAHPMATAIESGELVRGIAICGSGNGINMTLNKHQGIRAALCWLPEIAQLARQHNNANVLVMPGRFVSHELALEMVELFMETPFEGGRHQCRIDKIPLSK